MKEIITKLMKISGDHKRMVERTKLKILFITIVTIQSIQAQVYYPLQVGNLWEYQDPYDFSFFQRKVVRDTLMPNGERYAVIIPSSHILQENYFRQVGNQVFAYNTSDTTEKIRYDFWLNPGDTITITTHPPLWWIFRGSHTESVLGKQRTVYCFDIRDLSFYADEECIADSLGLILVCRDHCYFSYGIRGAIIDSVLYGTVTDIDIERQMRPLNFQLYQNYPNPFNPTTTIRYELKEKSLVSLQIFDILGRVVLKVVENEHQEAGEHTVTLDASGLSSGVYFYRLSTITNGQTVTHTKRMISLK